MTTKASNTTPHYGLSQWVGSDNIFHEDFNSDNAIIDTVLHAHETAMTTVRLAEVSIGEGTATHSVTIDLSGVDLSQYAKLVLAGGVPSAPDTHAFSVRARINGNATEGDYTRSDQKFQTASTLTEGGHTKTNYLLVGRCIHSRGGSYMEMNFCDGYTHLLMKGDTFVANYKDAENDTGLLTDTTFGYQWQKGKLKDMAQLELYYHDDLAVQNANFPVGTRFVLSGWKY